LKRDDPANVSLMNIPKYVVFVLKPANVMAALLVAFVPAAPTDANPIAWGVYPIDVPGSRPKELVGTALAARPRPSDVGETKLAEFFNDTLRMIWAR